MPFLICRSEADAMPKSIGATEAVIEVLHGFKVQPGIGDSGGFVLDTFETISPILHRKVPRLYNDRDGRPACAYETQDVQLPIVDQKTKRTVIATRSNGEVVEQEVTTYTCKATKEYAAWLCHRPGWKWFQITDEMADQFRGNSPKGHQPGTKDTGIAEYRELQGQAQALQSLGAPKIDLRSPMDKLIKYVQRYEGLAQPHTGGPDSGTDSVGAESVAIAQSGISGNG